MKAGSTLPEPKSAARWQALGNDRRLLWIIALAVLIAVARAVQMAWLSDDSFISFRYARNLAEGLGLVYNAGEYVEGYTNLLWTLAIAALMRLGLEPELMAHVLGIACWLALVAILAHQSYRRAGREQRAMLPLAAALTLLMEDQQRWATGGLETSLFGVLSCAGLLMVANADGRGRSLLLASLLLALATLTRPDGVLFAALGVVFAYAMPDDARIRQRLRDAARVALPLIVTGAALVAFKLAYYGDVFPTAFYAKSPLAHYYGQGAYYVWLFFERNWFALLFAPLALWPLRGQLRVLATKRNALWLSAFALFTLYVIHSAGDFMFGRRVMPALPFLWLLFEDLLWRCPSRPLALALFCLTLLAACLPRNLYDSELRKLHGVTQEWAFYPDGYVAYSRARGELARHFLGSSPVRATFTGGLCMFAYYSHLPYLVELNGLTQYSLAKQPLGKRGRAGHEKRINEAWMTANHIHLYFFFQNPPLVEGGARHLDYVRFGDQLTAMIWIYSDVIMDPLRNDPQIDFVPIEKVLAQAEKDLRAAPYATARQQLDFLERYYLHDAPPSRAALAARLRQIVADKQALAP